MNNDIHRQISNYLYLKDPSRKFRYKRWQFEYFMTKIWLL